MEAERTNFRLLDECERKYGLELIASSTQVPEQQTEEVKICFEFLAEKPDVLTFRYRDQKLSFKVDQLKDVLDFIEQEKA